MRRARYCITQPQVCTVTDRTEPHALRPLSCNPLTLPHVRRWIAGDADSLTRLIALGCKLDEPNWDGQTPYDGQTRASPPSANSQPPATTTSYHTLAHHECVRTTLTLAVAEQAHEIHPSTRALIHSLSSAALAMQSPSSTSGTGS